MSDLSTRDQFYRADRSIPRGRERRFRLAATDNSKTAGLVIRGRIGRADSSRAGLLVCDVGALTDADLGTVDALARLQLTARRLGGKVCLLHASAELRDLLALAGLRAVVPCSLPLPLEPRGQTEQREEPRGVEEERDPADSIA